ncbi:uncharacterized protein LOC105424916 [Pogonomyrmex barbatus]|uniref:Uncharacterized protein LOC105424916 n=1 Tax=Pogonomyrmex barbatus TaxID=144034 RepID=A0A6I9WPJ9_9HYME|nr:uncharacterized protein LOC105424916 [Pogonomyrmex barbatus]
MCHQEVALICDVIRWVKKVARRSDQMDYEGEKKSANVIFDAIVSLQAPATLRKIPREFADSVSQKYENQVSSCSLISIASRHTQDVTSTRAGGMYSQSVVFPRLAVIQSAKWKDRNGLWFGFRIIHYAAHNTPSPATAVLHTQLGRD